MRDLFEFVWAVVNNWAGYFTGGMIVATITLYFMWRDKPMGRTIGLTLSALFLFMAFFKAWKEQRSLGAATATQNQQLREQIDELTKSAISGTIDFAVLGAQPKNSSHAALIVSLSNKAAASAVEPGSWNLTSITNDQIEHPGEPNTLLDKNLDFLSRPQARHEICM
jgi:hypothetical protein